MTATHFNEEQKKKLKVLFDKMDVDKSGTIEAKDLKALAAEFGRTMTDERAAELIAKGDPEKTGKVTFPNFCVALEHALPKVEALAVAVAVFKEIDKDKSGAITKDELKKVVKEAGANVPDAKIDELVTKMDKDKDGKITFKEFLGCLADHIRAQAK